VRALTPIDRIRAARATGRREPSSPTMATLLVILILVLAGCGSDAPPDPVQLDSAAGAQRLTARQASAVAATAAGDPAIATALREGEVGRVVVQALPAGAAVAFLFTEPAEPAASPFEVVCDIAGQTPGWRGVAALVAGGRVQDASPVWLTGANCAGIAVPG